MSGMKKMLFLGCLLSMCPLVVAEPQEDAASILQAVYDYDVMVIEVYDAEGSLTKCHTLTHSQAEEVAQVLVPLRAADAASAQVGYPRCVLRIRTIHGSYCSLILNCVSPDEDGRYSLPLVEYDRLQGVLLELGL